MKRALMALALCSTAALASETGPLSMLGWAENFDWHYKVGAVPQSSFGSVPLALQSTFKWNGSAGTMQPQHAVLAYTQRLTNDRFNNQYGEQIWSHGAGAIVGEFGLGLELWFRALNNGVYGPPNAYVWSQVNGRCLQDVQGTVPENTLCLPSTPNGDAYITTAPGFQLQRNTPYTLRVEYVPTGGWVSMQAELWNSAGVLVQSGRIGFQPAQFFPSATLQAVPVVARTPGSAYEPTVNYTFTVVPK